jgi:small subunit ribosomal protein S19
MAKKEFIFKGKSLEELQALSTKEFAELLPTNARRKIKRGFTEAEQIFLKNVISSEKPVKTHCRGMIILPSMVGKLIRVYSGHKFEDLHVVAEMVGHRLGEFILTRRRVSHGDAGVGATKGKGAVSVR